MPLPLPLKSKQIFKSKAPLKRENQFKKENGKPFSRKFKPNKLMSPTLRPPPAIPKVQVEILKEEEIVPPKSFKYEVGQRDLGPETLSHNQPDIFESHKIICWKKSLVIICPWFA